MTFFLQEMVSKFCHTFKCLEKAGISQRATAMLIRGLWSPCSSLEHAGLAMQSSLTHLTSLGQLPFILLMCMYKRCKLIPAFRTHGGRHEGVFFPVQQQLVPDDVESPSAQ